MKAESARRVFLREIVTTESAVEELLLYTRPQFKAYQTPKALRNKGFEEAWETYVSETEETSVFEVIKKTWKALNFPISKDISKTQDYRNAILKGQLNSLETTLELEAPECLKLELFESPLLGKIPMLTIGNTNDFKNIIRGLLYKSEPVPLPDAMGAAFVRGLNNWDRIHQLKRTWEQACPELAWPQLFKSHIAPKPELYKDQVMLLSEKPYSGVSANALGLSKSLWKEYSWIIRRDHECAHLFTSMYYGHMAKNMHDEIVADYAGIQGAIQYFDKTWFLHFMGLEDYPKYRKGGRLENYQGSQPLSTEAFKGLMQLVVQAAHTIEQFDQNLGAVNPKEERYLRWRCLCEVDLLTMATPEGIEALHSKYKSLSSKVDASNLA